MEDRSYELVELGDEGKTMTEDEADEESSGLLGGAKIDESERYRRENKEQEESWAASVDEAIWYMSFRLQVLAGVCSLRHGLAAIMVSAALGRAFVALPWAVRLSLDSVPPFATLVAYSRYRLAHRRYRRRILAAEDEDEAVSEHPQRKRLRQWLGFRKERQRHREARRCCPRTKRQGARWLERSARDYGICLGLPSSKALIHLAAFCSLCDGVFCLAEVLLATTLRSRLCLDPDGHRGGCSLGLDASFLAYVLAACLGFLTRLATTMILGLKTLSTTTIRPTVVRRWRDILRLVSTILFLLGILAIAAAGRSADRLGVLAASHSSLHSRSGGRALLPFPPNQVILNLSATAKPLIELRGGRSRRRQIVAPVSPSSLLVTSIDWGKHELNASTARLVLVDLQRNITSMPSLMTEGTIVWLPEIGLRPNTKYAAAIFGVRRLDNGDLAEAEVGFAALRALALSGSMLDLEEAVLGLAQDDDTLSTIAKQHVEELRAAQSLSDHVLPALEAALPSQKPQFAWAFRTAVGHHGSMVDEARKALSKTISLRLLSSESQRETRSRRHSSRNFLHLGRSLATAYRSFFLAKHDSSSVITSPKKRHFRKRAKNRPQNVHFGTFRAPLRENDHSLFSMRSSSSDNTSGFWRILQRIWHALYVSSSAMSRRRRPVLLRLPLTAERSALVDNITAIAVYVHHRNADRSAACRGSLARIADAGGWAIVAAERPGASRLDALRLARALLSGDLIDLVRLAKSDTVALLDALALLRTHNIHTNSMLPVFLLADRESAGLALSAASLAKTSGHDVRLVLIDPDPLTSRAAAIANGTATDAQVFAKLLRFALIDGTPAFLVLLAMLQGYWDRTDGSLCSSSPSIRDNVLVLRTPPSIHNASLSSTDEGDWGDFPVVIPSILNETLAEVDPKGAVASAIAREVALRFFASPTS